MVDGKVVHDCTHGYTHPEHCRHGCREKNREAIAAVDAARAKSVRDGVFGLGVVLLAVGCWLVWAPLAFIVVGLILTLAAFWGTLRDPR